MNRREFIGGAAAFAAAAAAIPPAGIAAEHTGASPQWYRVTLHHFHDVWRGGERITFDTVYRRDVGTPLAAGGYIDGAGPHDVWWVEKCEPVAAPVPSFVDVNGKLRSLVVP